MYVCMYRVMNVVMNDATVPSNFLDSWLLMILY